jgi:hypothetical protein
VEGILTKIDIFFHRFVLNAPLYIE